MNTDIVPFTFDGHELRHITINGEPWFHVIDACAILGLDNTTEALRGFRRDRLSFTESIDSLGRKFKTRIINEGGLYRLVLRSNKPTAERFQDWICDVVIPTIRKTGQFTLGVPMVCLKPTKWTRMFPKEFYVEIFRLKGKIMPEDLSTEPWLGPETIDLIYKRLADDLFQALQKANPRIGRWRSNKLHQNIAEGEPKEHLRMFIAECAGAMGSFSDGMWSAFKAHWNQKHPIRRELPDSFVLSFADGQLFLPFGSEIEP